MKSTKGPDRMYGTLRVCAGLFRDIANFSSNGWEAFFWGGGWVGNNYRYGYHCYCLTVLEFIE